MSASAGGSTILADCSLPLGRSIQDEVIVIGKTTPQMTAKIIVQVVIRVFCVRFFIIFIIFCFVNKSSNEFSSCVLAYLISAKPASYPPSASLT